MSTWCLWNRTSCLEGWLHASYHNRLFLLTIMYALPFALASSLYFGSCFCLWSIFPLLNIIHCKSPHKVVSPNSFFPSDPGFALLHHYSVLFSAFDTPVFPFCPVGKCLHVYTSLLYHGFLFSCLCQCPCAHSHPYCLGCQEQTREGTELLSWKKKPPKRNGV